jgi:hypothetical protein
MKCKTKTMMILSVLTALILLAGSVTWAHGPAGQRQRRQSERISGGVRTGKITKGESIRLNREQRRIRQAFRHAWRDGCMSPRERRHINRLQAKAGRHIYLAKHNSRVRHGHHWPRKFRPWRHRPRVRLHPYFGGVIFEPGWSLVWSFDLR